MTLSKSQYTRGLQCQKSLWLHKHKPKLRDTPDTKTKSILKTGDRVGELAKELFAGGVEIEFTPNDFSSMVEKTKELIEIGKDVICEATFKHNGIFVMVDILFKNGSSWDIYEVKSSTKVKDYHLDDVSIQWYAIYDLLSLNRAFVVHIDNTYERKNELDIDALFKKVDVTDIVKQKQHSIKSNLKEFKDMLRSDMPDIDIGVHCFTPFDCDFYGYCWSDIPSVSVFDLYRLSGDKKFQLHYDGKVDFADLSSDLKLNDTQTLQLKTAKTKKPHIDKPIIKEFLESISYPINFFDFETFQDAVPRFEGQKPFSQIPFQYSLHILYEDGRLTHKEFLADENIDPRDALIKEMLKDITKDGSIVAYNQGFEKGVIKSLVNHNPKYADKLLALNDRFVDLIVPFRRGGYYHPDFNGSFSLKSVLPAMFSDEDELDYKKLGSVQNGAEAMDTFASLHLVKDETQRQKIREDLLAYCKLDTLAMVRIWEKLKDMVQYDLKGGL